MIRSGAASLLLAIALAPSACRERVPRRVFRTTSAFVRGTIVDRTGAPVSGVAVLVEAYRDSCAGPATGNQRAVALTDPRGRFDSRVWSPLGPFSACLKATAAIGVGAARRRAMVTAGPVRLRDDYPDGQPHDSVRMDLTLPWP